jgi:hypothetical protein
MVSVLDAVKAEAVKCGSGKRDYRNLWRVDRIVHRQLFYGCGKKREHQLKVVRYRMHGKTIVQSTQVTSPLAKILRSLRIPLPKKILEVSD